MSYNLKNKSVVLFAVTFAVMATLSGNAYSEENAKPNVDVVQENAPVDSVASDDLLADMGIADEVPVAENVENKTEDPINDDALFGLDEEITEGANPSAEPTPQPQPENSANDIDIPPLPDDTFFDTPENNLSPDNANPNPMPNSAVPNNIVPNNAAPNNIAPNNMAPNGQMMANPAAEQMRLDEPKSPFEKYGNAILSKVDNDLFNQMSNIEKQTTLLNLELKREQVQNQIDALRAQREKASREEQQRIADEEERAKDNEARRKAEIAEAEAKVKEKEIELEKVKQAKVLNEYMNEMLIINQQWVENNGILTNRVNTLMEEKEMLINDFEGKMASLQQQLGEVEKMATEAQKNHEEQVTGLNNQIAKLRQALLDSENTIKQMQSGEIDNPFAQQEIDPDAIDMSKEYAIMDITGKGDSIVAKIVGTDGTTFIVHKGSVLKGGEVVTSISDNYISFDNHGVPSYLYTGGTVMQYEPTKAFNDASKTPEKAEGVKNNKQSIRNVRGVSTGGTLKSNVNSALTNGRANTQNVGKIKTNANAVPSFSQGMMVK